MTRACVSALHSTGLRTAASAAAPAPLVLAGAKELVVTGDAIATVVAPQSVYVCLCLTTGETGMVRAVECGR